MTDSERVWMTQKAYVGLQMELAALRSQPTVEVPDDLMECDDLLVAGQRARQARIHQIHQLLMNALNFKLNALAFLNFIFKQLTAFFELLFRFAMPLNFRFERTICFCEFLGSGCDLDFEEVPAFLQGLLLFLVLANALEISSRGRRN